MKMTVEYCYFDRVFQQKCIQKLKYFLEDKFLKLDTNIDYPQKQPKNLNHPMSFRILFGVTIGTIKSKSR